MNINIDSPVQRLSIKCDSLYITSNDARLTIKDTSSDGLVDLSTVKSTSDNRLIAFENCKKYVINTSTPTGDKRLLEVMREFDKFNISVQRFDAILPSVIKKNNFDVIPRKSHNDGQVGCFLSHYCLLEKHLKSNKNTNLCIFEDDVFFCEDFFQRVDYIEENFSLEWDIFYFSSFYHLNNDKKKWKDIEYEKTSIKYIHRVYSPFCLQAYIVNFRSVNKILDLLKKVQHETYAIDHAYILLGHELKQFCFTPGMSSQRPGLSEIQKTESDQTKQFMNICGPHIFINKLEDFNYDEYFK